MTTNNKISNLIESQAPFFVRSDHQTFIAFLEAYYEFLEQYGNTIERAKTVKDFRDSDTTVDEFSDYLYETFLKLIPDNVIVDKSLLTKHIKDFYRAKGTEKSIKFLLRILFGPSVDDTYFYYPKSDILKASDGKWYIEKSIKFGNATIDGVSNNNIDAIKIALEGKKIRGNTSNATALVERVDHYFENGTEVREIKVSNQSKDFVSGEDLSTTFDENGITKIVSVKVFSGEINSVYIKNPGTGYYVNDPVIIESITGSGANLVVSSVSSGNIRSIYVVNGGAGYQSGDPIIISGGGGYGATANVLTVQATSLYHPNTYNIAISTILLEANTPIGNTVYSNLNSIIVDPANDTSGMANSFTYFIYGNTGPVLSTFLITTGTGYSAPPAISVQANTRIKELGILGRMEIISGGNNYTTNDTLTFTNIPGGLGTGAKGNVTNVDVNGSITEVKFYEEPNKIPGGTGFSDSTGTAFLPIVNISTSTGNGANVIVTSLLGSGGIYGALSDEFGSILGIKIVSGGTNYQTAPTLNLTSSGDGTAQVTSTIVTGIYTYPGRYLNDDGHVSAYNFLEDRDYYQTFSYVVRTRESINKYRKYLKDLIHPAGTKLFGEYINTDGENTNNLTFQGVNTKQMISISGIYKANSNATNTKIEITLARTVTNTTCSYIEYTSGVISNLSNGLYQVTPNTTNSFILYIPSIFGNTTGNVVASIQ